MSEARGNEWNHKFLLTERWTAEGEENLSLLPAPRFFLFRFVSVWIESNFMK